MNTEAVIYLSNGDAVLVDEADHEWLSRFNWYPHKARQTQHKVYAYTKTGTRKKGLSMHRLIMEAKPGQMVDHANGNTLDNRRSNLRLCSSSENAANRAHRRGASGFVGVHATRSGRWRAIVQKEGRKHTAGPFPSAAEAAAARDALAVSLYGSFAELNFPRAA